MELHELEAFEAVILHQSFTRAAEALYLTQPAVTRQIAALEARLHTRLFDRLGRTVRLTAAGEALHRYSEQILRLAGEAQGAVADIEAGRAGRLAVGASITLATYVLPALLRRFRDDSGGADRVEVTIHTGVSARILEMVREGTADVGLVTGGGDDAEAADSTPVAARDPAIVVQALVDYATCVVTPPRHPLADQVRISAAQIAPFPLILMEPGTNLRTYVDRLLSSAGVRPRVTLELDNVEAIKRMVEAELGISVLPQVSVATEVLAGRLAALTLIDAPRRSHRRIALIYRRDKYRTTVLREFLALLESELSRGGEETPGAAAL